MECTNCCDEIEDGEEITDDDGNPFCCQEHLDRYHEDDEMAIGDDE